MLFVPKPNLTRTLVFNIYLGVYYIIICAEELTCIATPVPGVRHIRYGYTATNVSKTQLCFATPKGIIDSFFDDIQIKPLRGSQGKPPMTFFASSIRPI